MTEEKPPLFDRVVRAVIICVILAGMALPTGLWAAKKYLNWQPPRFVNNVLKKLPF